MLPRPPSIAAATLALTLLAPATSQAATLQQEMQTAGDALSALVPYIYNDERFRSRQNSDFILQQMNRLIGSMEGTAHQLNDHAKIRMISQTSLVQQLQQAKQRFQQGDHATAQYLLAGAPVLCSSCHIQDGVPARHAPVLQREHFANDFSYAELNYYLRNYPVALASYERYLQTPEVGDSWIRGGKTLERLLDISLITEKDITKTRARLHHYTGMPTLSDGLKKQIAEWLTGIEALPAKDLSPATIEPQLTREFGAWLEPRPEASLPETKRPLALLWRAALQQQSNAATTREETARNLYLLAILDRLLGEQTELSLTRLYLKECAALKVSPYSEKCLDEYEKRQQFFYGTDSTAALPGDAAAEIALMRKALQNPTP